MTAQDTLRRMVGRRVMWLIAAVALSTVLFAPILSGGYCADAVDPDKSYCDTWQRSIIGIDTNWWMWAAALVLSTAIAWALSRSRAR